MKILYYILFLLLLYPFQSTGLSMDRDQNGKWWIKHYHQLTQKECKWVQNANNVFLRVYAAADKRANRNPKLIIIKKNKQLLARSLEDGSIIITRKTLEFCYENIKKQSDYTKEEIGNTRLAFILGHEMAHLSCDDHWFVQKKSVHFIYDDQSFNNDYLEFRADDNGLIYTAIAGYQVDTLFSTNFFNEWIDHLSPKTVQSYKPSPKSRHQNIEQRLSTTRSQIVFFDMGIRLFHAGKYEKAIDFLEHFKHSFPSREVCHNLGIIYLQQALEKRLYIEPDFLKGFRLSMIVDLNSRISKTIERKKLGDSDIVRYRQAFHKKIRKAIQYFTQALQRDPFYDLSALHLALCQIISKNYDKAISLFDEIQLTDKKYQSFKQVNKNIAILLKHGDHTAQSVLSNVFLRFKEILQKRPDDWLVQYNLHILKSHFEQFYNPPLCWNDYYNSQQAKGFEKAINKMDHQVITIQKYFSFLKPSDLKPGLYLNLKDQHFQNVFSDQLLYSVDLYTDSKKNRLLVLGKILELIELKTKIPVPDDIKTAIPNRIYDSCAMTRTWIFDHMAIDIKNNKVVAVLIY